MTGDPYQMPDAGPVVWLRAGDLADLLEHDGTINDGEHGQPGGHLQAVADSMADLTETAPAVLAFQQRADGTWAVSVVDGNHRLILTLDEPGGPDRFVPVRIVDHAGTHPGFPYDGRFDAVLAQLPGAPRARR